MNNRSNLPEDDKIGCAVIKEMRKDVSDLKNNKFAIPLIAWLFCILGFVIATGFVVRTFLPSRISEKIVYEIKVDKANNADGKIDDAAIKKELAEALIAVEARAANAYNDKFVTLLTVLTIFGIAWPLIVAFAQYKFNERELNKIQNTDAKATDSLSEAKIARVEANEALVKAQKAQEEINNTDEVVKGLFEAFKTSNRRSWQGQVAIYAHLSLVLARAKIGDTPIYNLLKIMSLHCECSRITFGNSKNVYSNDVKRINNVLSNISIEKQKDDISEINKEAIGTVKLEIEDMLTHDQKPEIKQELEEILQKVSGLHEAYKQLLSDGTGDGSKA